MVHRALGVILRPGQNLSDLIAPYLYYKSGDEQGQKYLVREDVDDAVRKGYQQNHGKYNSIDDFVAMRYNYVEKDPETGRFYTLRNPRAFMDSWVLGGRWAGELKLRPGVQKDEVQNKNLIGGSARMLMVDSLFGGGCGDNGATGYASIARIGDIITELDEVTSFTLKRLWGLLTGTIPITDTDRERWPGIYSDDSVRTSIEEWWGCEENFLLMQKFNNFREYITPDGNVHDADGAAAQVVDNGYIELFGTYYCGMWKLPIQKRFKEFWVPENYFAIVDYHC